MTAKHRDPEYRKNARIVQQQVARLRRLGEDVICQRCGLPIGEDQAFDVGHVDPNGGHGRDNLGPEHRYKSGRCQGNRAHGGRLGQARQAARYTQTKGLLPW